MEHNPIDKWLRYVFFYLGVMEGTSKPILLELVGQANVRNILRSPFTEKVWPAFMFLSSELSCFPAVCIYSLQFSFCPIVFHNSSPVFTLLTHPISFLFAISSLFFLTISLSASVFILPLQTSFSYHPYRRVFYI